MAESRRRFLEHSAAAGVGLATLSTADLWAAQSAPTDRIGVGVIGCNGMGFSDIQSMLKRPEAECVALCDVDASVLARRAGDIERMTGTKPPVYGDFRRILENPDVDAVVIGTPDHWHCLQMVMACEASKDVYVEKPLANSIEECRLMVSAAERYDRVVQVGQWQRSGPHWADAIAFLQSGALGRIRTARAWAYMNWMPEVPMVPDGPTPDGVDYDMWLGPAPQRRFNPNRFHFNFRWFWDYAGGLMTDWGVHLIDIVLYGMQATAPNSIVASGGKFAYPDDAEETPDTLQAIYEFDDFSMIWEHAVGIGLGPFQRDHGVAFIGNEGTLVVDRGRWEVFPETGTADGKPYYKMDPVPEHRAVSGQGGLDQHTENFLECMKTRQQPRCNADTGSLAAVNAHLGNVAFRTDRKVHWDEAGQRFRDDAEANAFLTPTYRGPWALPRV
ncbi:MAG: Gfo/Idh/MocA family oxidoreductase [Vicinamibacterales bacterium]|jgi:predicted dehydrogenase|nr:oxidoreductase [Acidobacteriota bacterium]MDP7472608.1 Gfo/Idh/MocA family oxidoreductase [Vicinamibacterales bacterium]MDP7670767.1 Gfo/Idh/MocA family oxidoreductase [Vicinamibacterales bacterium]HJO37774.1 Gfo/Idh/MocA family oxidoreductase [Vicinamibacterales bacterium]